MAVNIKLGVDMSSFKSGIQEANAQLKTFDAQLKFAETTFKKTGDAEAAMSTKTEALTKKLATQKNVVKQYEKALEDMKNAGVDPASKSYQQMAAAMLNMQSAANETEIALNGLSASQLTAANTADKLTQSVNGIGKKMSLDQVISGIDKITGALENAGKKALQVGENIWNNILNSARLADDTGTAAMLLDMNVEEYQKYKGVFDTIAEMTVSDWMNAKRKVQKAIYDPTDDQKTVLSLLGVSTHDTAQGKWGEVQTAARTWEDVFWDAAGELRKRIESGQISADLGDTYAEALFGKKAAYLKPLMDLGREGFAAALEDQNVASQEAIETDAKLADTVTKLDNTYKALEMQLISALAPALTEAAEAMDSLLGSVLEYLQSENGKAMMDSLGESLKELFEGLKNVNPQEVAQKLVDVLNSIVGGMKWLIDHKEDVFHALEWIVGGWATLKLTGGALDVLKVIEGAKNLTVGGSGTETGAETTTTDAVVTGTGTGGSVWSKLLNGATLFAVADAMYKATEGQIRKNVENFNKSTEGMTDQQRQREALKINFGMTDDEVTKFVKEKEIDVSTEFVPEDDAAKKLADEVGVVVLPAQLHILGGTRGIGTGGENMMRMLGETANAAYSYANGIPFVNDTRLALLHRGERVLTASENRHYTYNSNTYFGSVNLNNGLQVEALAESIARNNRRKNSGYGS